MDFTSAQDLPLGTRLVVTAAPSACCDALGRTLTITYSMGNILTVQFDQGESNHLWSPPGEQGWEFELIGVQ